MSTTIQSILLDLMQQAIEDPDHIPVIPLDVWPEGTEQQQLLTGFRDMLERLRQHYQDKREVTDITSSKLAEQQLHEQEEQYRSIFEASTDALMIGDLEDGHIVEANPAAYQMYGYSYEEFIGLGPDTITPPDYQHLPGEARQLIKEGGKFQSRGVALHKDGSTFYVEAHGTPFTYKGKPHQLASVRNITEQVQAEQQLREKEEQYRSIFEAGYDGLVINDLDGFCVEANPTYCRMLGYTYEEIIGLHYSQTTFPEYYPILDENSRSIQAGVQFQTQGLARRKDGSALPVEALSTPFTYKGKPHMLGVMRDITERVQAEEQLREKEEQYRSIFEATTDGLIISNLRGLIIEANPAACKMYGYAYEEFVGLYGTDITSQDAHFLLMEALQTIRTDGRPLSPIRATGLRKDGTTFPTEGYGTPIMYKGKRHILAVVRDITGQVQAEEQLREREEQYRSIFEATTDGLFITDFEDGHLVQVNPAACRMHGYSYEEFIALHPTAFIHPNSHHLFAEYLQTVKAGGQFHARAYDIRKDGTTFPVEVYGTTFIYKSMPRVLGIVRDITKQVQAEQQLREKEEQYRSIFEATNDGLDILDPDGFIVEANPAFCRMFGYTREELIGLEAGKLTAPQSRHLVEESRESIKEGRDIQVEGLALRKDGSIFHAEAHLTALIYQGKPHMLGVTRDITERVRAEQELREKEEQYRSIFEATNDALFIMDLEDGHIIEANPAACNIYGYSYEEFIGLPPRVFIHPDVLPTFLERGLPLIRAGGKRHIQGVNLRKDGSAFPIDLHQTAFTYQGKPHILSVMRDITEQVQAQQLLEQRVEERTRELSTLLEISHNVASTIELKPLLDLILDQLKAVVDYTGSSLTIVDHEDLVLVGTRGPESEEHLIQRRFSLKHFGLIWEMACRQEPVIIDDVRDDSPLARAYREAVGELLQTTLHYIHSWLGVPLIVKERVIGLLAASHSESNYYKPHHATLALGIATQAAVAIENARLYEQAQELAAVEERQRLARELHDSVSQALYGISLGVHTARLQLDHNPGDLAESLDYVLELAEAALTEMRALIFELRPESLEAEGLVVALTRQAAAMYARHGITVQLDLCSEPDLTLKVKRELYRVAQEALHNTVKHAGASRVDLRLRLVDGVVILEVSDDGKGFKATGSFPGHLGLHSMHERIESLDGWLHIESVLGQGTSIRAHIPTHKTTNLTPGE